MDKSIDIPVIPKRPDKTSRVIDVAEVLDDKSKREQPIIPRRPQKSNSNSDSSTPVIPARPRFKNKRESSSKDLSNSDDLGDKFMSDLISATEVSVNLKELENYSEQSDDKTESINGYDYSEKLNCELEQNSGISDTDGEKTPGNTNTKITFKDSVDSFNSTSMNPDNNSEFNDDLETVLQEKEEYIGNSSSHTIFDHLIENYLGQVGKEFSLNNSDLVNLESQIMSKGYRGENNTTQSFETSSEKDLGGFSKEKNDHLQNKANITLSETGHLEGEESLEVNRCSLENYSKKLTEEDLDIEAHHVPEKDATSEKSDGVNDRDLKCMGFEKVRPMETNNSNGRNDDDLNSDILSSEQLTSEVTGVHVLPSRSRRALVNSFSKRSKEDLDTETWHVPEEDVTTSKKCDIESDRVLNSLHSDASNDDVTPIGKNANENKNGPMFNSMKYDGPNSETFSDKQSISEVKEAPIIPNRPRKSDKQDVQDKIKPPPPKPKKLSSKIAAFQQMFNLEQVEKRREIPHANINKGPTKLSSDKQKFAESLKGVMGIPLPGMVNPLSKLPDKNLVDEDTDSHMNANQVSIDATSIPKNRRVKGPKGKKLPKALKEPINIESELKLSMFTASIWELRFSKSTKSERIETIEETALPNPVIDKSPSADELTNLEPDNNAGILDISQDRESNENIVLIESPSMSKTEDRMNINYDDDITESKAENSYVDKTDLKEYADSGEKNLESQIDSKNELGFEPQNEHNLKTVNSIQESDITCNDETSDINA